MKWILLAMPLAVFPATAQTQTDLDKELRIPKRIVASTTVDITPLVKWQMSSSKEPRPLKPWEFLSGTVVGTNNIGWIINAIIGKDPQPKTIALRNPPRAQQDEYNRLVTRHAWLNRQIVVAQREAAAAVQRLRAIEEEYRRQQFFRFVGDALDIAGQQAQQAQVNAEQIAAQIQSFDWQGHDPSLGFIFKGYAVRTGLLYNKAPIFDYGIALK